mmetsp:Transcript_5203/g.14975  ORF Transcript_5203/g.14975 Transcript_5203/m.14975 type:complete len:162 (-) Transcript_5203:377-862(-)
MSDAAATAGLQVGRKFLARRTLECGEGKNGMQHAGVGLDFPEWIDQGVFPNGKITTKAPSKIGPRHGQGTQTFGMPSFQGLTTGSDALYAGCIQGGKTDWIFGTPNCCLGQNGDTLDMILFGRQPNRHGWTGADMVVDASSSIDEPLYVFGSSKVGRHAQG